MWINDRDSSGPLFEGEKKRRIIERVLLCYMLGLLSKALRREEGMEGQWSCQRDKKKGTLLD